MKYRKECTCGSGKECVAKYDARGIFLCYVCPRCEAKKLASFRPDVLTDPNYPVFEPIEPEEY